MTRNTPVDPEAPDSKDAGDDPFASEAIDWFVRLQAAKDDPAAARAFRSWLEGDPRRAAAFAKVAEVWGAPELLLATKNVARQTGFAPKRRRRPPVSPAKKTVLIVVTAAAFAFGAAHLPDLLIRLRSDFVTATGERQVVPLPDGSTMTMNAETAVALDFTDGNRNVRLLRGEAYFDVRSMEQPTFQVEGRFGKAVVKGTAFAMKLDDDDDSVVLSRGALDVVRLSQPSDRAVLDPGKTVSVTSSMVTPVAEVDAERSLAWLKGRISFSDKPLGQVLNDLRRYYPGRIFVVRSGVEQVAVDGSYKLDQPLLAIRSLAKAAGASVTVLPGGFVIIR